MKRCLIALLMCVLPLQGIGMLQGEETPAKDRKKSVTVYPIAVVPSDKFPASVPERLAEVVGMFLEKAGMEQTEIAESPFAPPKTDDPAKLADAFGQFVAKQSLKTEYAFFAQILAPERKIKEIRTIVVDKIGKVIFDDLADEKTFSQSEIKPDEPMTACLFIFARLGKVWELADPQRDNAPKGKMAELMNKRSGSPPKEEIAAMEKRIEVLIEKKTPMKEMKVTLYPIHLWEGSDKSGAAQLAKMLNKEGICQAETTDSDPKLKIKGDPNEQKILWDTARGFRDFLRKNPPATEYALLASYGISPASDGKREAIGVHLILCDKSGDWVATDYQNSHHPDFQSIAPKSIEDCNRLAVKRLKDFQNHLSK